jgi:putative protease
MMEFTTYLQKAEGLEGLRQAGVKEVLIEPQALARLGTLEVQEANHLLQAARAQGFRTVLCWDVLADEATLRSGARTLAELDLSLCSAVRIQDAGVLEWVLQHHPELPVHWLSESRNHNRRALQRWIEKIGPQLQRLILSPELPGKLLNEYAGSLGVPCEVLGAGRLLLFHSPRFLIAHGSQSRQERQVRTESQPHHPFPTLENQHGTFLFHNRDLFLLDRLQALPRMHTVRVDGRFLPEFSEWPELLERSQALLKVSDAQESQAAELRSLWPVRTTHGFFRANRTERPIERLQNRFLQERNEQLVATVIESLKGEYLALFTRQPLEVGEQLIAQTPDGRLISFQLNWLRSSAGEEQEEVGPETLCLTAHVKSVTPQTLIYRTTPSQAPSGP